MNNLFCGLDDATTLGPCQDHLLGEARWHQFDRPHVAVCVTLYNESVLILRATLHSLVLALQEKGLQERAQQRAFAGRSRAGPDCICIVADGMAHLAPEVLAYMVEQGWAVDPIQASADTHLTHCYFSVGTYPASSDETMAGAFPALRFIVCLKQANQGKLHSHALFLARLCERMKPEICCQIDAGTTVGRQSLEALSHHFKHHPDSGALAARVSCGTPAATDSLLVRWQAMDFAVQLATHWPAELISGHLSVIPGQFCAFRWEALAGTGGHDNGPGKRPSPSVMGRYLRGLVPANALERIMYLAEDRVIGNELVLAPSRYWRLDYGLGASAVTDACATLPELQRQRRRWNNCSFACRLWLLSQWPALLTRSDRSIWFKLRLSVALLWQLVLALLQAATPAAVICTTAAICQAFFEAWAQPGTWLPPLSLGALSFSVPLMFWTPRDGRLLRGYGALRDAVALAAMLLVIASVSRVLPVVTVVLIWLPVTASAALAALPIYSAPVPPLQVLRRVPEFIATNGLIQLLLWRYALAHLHDTSWGTKGLVSSVARGAEQPMRRLARGIAASWLLVNAALIGVGLALPSQFAPGINLVAEVVCGLTALSCTMALLYLVGTRAGPLWRALPGRRGRDGSANSSLAALTRD